jgi:16S rRNA (adenine1518-N6/adenine1519-N6)-dimethyltransferase
MGVKPKKHFGQHFLTDHEIARRIAETLSGKGYHQVVEIGPGMGVLTQFLQRREMTLFLVEIDRDSVAYLNDHYPDLTDRIVAEDVLRLNWSEHFGPEPFAVIGNFPYNISSQILFKCLEFRAHIPEFAGMFQKEVAQRICEGPGTRNYGILSVLTQAFYEAEYLFTVGPDRFRPPPKVDSGVIRLTRKKEFRLPVDETLFFRVVKMAFNQRRKTLRNSLKQMNLSDMLREDSIFARRPEQLSVLEFIALSKKIESDVI